MHGLAQGVMVGRRAREDVFARSHPRRARRGIRQIVVSTAPPSGVRDACERVLVAILGWRVASLAERHRQDAASGVGLPTACERSYRQTARSHAVVQYVLGIARSQTHVELLYVGQGWHLVHPWRRRQWQLLWPEVSDERLILERMADIL
jgi:hypothetical protein